MTWDLILRINTKEGEAKGSQTEIRVIKKCIELIQNNDIVVLEEPEIIALKQAIMEWEKLNLTYN